MRIIFIIFFIFMISINCFAFDINGVKIGSNYSNAKSKIKSIKNVDKRYNNDEDGYFEMLGMMIIPPEEDVIYFNHGGIAVFSDLNNKVFAIIIVGKDIDLIFDSYKLNAELLAKKIAKIENGKAYLNFPKLNYTVKCKNLNIAIGGDKSVVIIMKGN